MIANRYLLITNRIRAAYEMLTATEKRIADYILKDTSEVIGKSAAELGEVTSTSPATVFRFCKTIGFDGFMDFKLSLENSTLDSNIDNLQLEEEDSTSMIMQKVLRFNRNSIDDMIVGLDSKALEDMVELICRAERVVIMGDGGSGCSARAAYDVFLKMGMRCEYVHDPFLELLVVSQLTDKDLLLVILNSGRSINTVENCQLAKEIGVPLVGIVGVANMPISKYLDIEVLASASSMDNFCDTISARICELSIISIIHSMLMLRSEGNSQKKYSDRSRVMEQKRYPKKKL